LVDELTETVITSEFQFHRSKLKVTPLESVELLQCRAPVKDVGIGPKKSLLAANLEAADRSG